MDASKRRFMNRGIRATRSRSRETQRGLCEINQVAFRVVVNGTYGVYGVESTKTEQNNTQMANVSQLHCNLSHPRPTRSLPFPSMDSSSPGAAGPPPLRVGGGPWSIFRPPQDQDPHCVGCSFFCLGEANCTKAVNHVVVVFTGR